MPDEDSECMDQLDILPDPEPKLINGRREVIPSGVV